jgi:hypothetical protein
MDVHGCTMRRARQEETASLGRWWATIAFSTASACSPNASAAASSWASLGAVEPDPGHRALFR